jgi:hypothetical protein
VEDAPVVNLEDGRGALQKEEEEYKQAILNLGDQSTGGRKAEEAPLLVDLKDAREVPQEVQNDDDKSSMKQEEYKQAILDLHGQTRFDKPALPAPASSPASADNS